MTMRATMAGAIMGTAAYMSPEQARGQAVDKRADIWSFGAVVYELLTGKPLFTGGTVSDTLAAVLRHEPDFTAVPPRFHKLLRLCLTRDPRRRLRDISGARLLLDNPVPTAVATAPKRAWIPWALAAALAGVAALSWIRPAAPGAPVPTYSLTVVPPEGTSLYFDAFTTMHELSPDGRTLAFVGVTEGIRRVWLRPFDSPLARALPGTESAEGVFWSPDSRHIGVMLFDSIKRVELATGAVKDVCQAQSPLRGASWGSDGTILFAVTAPLGLHRVPADGGDPVPVTAVDRKNENAHN